MYGNRKRSSRNSYRREGPKKAQEISPCVLKHMEEMNTKQHGVIIEKRKKAISYQRETGKTGQAKSLKIRLKARKAIYTKWGFGSPYDKVHRRFEDQDFCTGLSLSETQKHSTDELNGQGVSSDKLKGGGKKNWGASGTPGSLYRRIECQRVFIDEVETRESL